MHLATILRFGRPALLTVPLLGVACGGLTREEARESLEEVKVASQSQALTSESIELSTNFTLGKGARAAGEQLRDFLRTQLPCAGIELSVEDDSATVTIEYGVTSDSCSYRGTSLDGRHIIHIARNEDDLVQVDHVFDGISNGRVMVDGTATVEWNVTARERHVVHDATWTRLSDGRTGQGSGDRLQRALVLGSEEGLSVDGEHHWKGERGTWDLGIEQVEMRWVDPIPQAGTYTLDTPFGKTVSFSFERVSDTAIQVTVTGPRRSFDFQVESSGDRDTVTESAEPAEIADGGATGTGAQ